jgi:hypothetical protein
MRNISNIATSENITENVHFTQLAIDRKILLEQGLEKKEWKFFPHGSTDLVDLGLLVIKFRDHTQKRHFR